MALAKNLWLFPFSASYHAVLGCDSGGDVVAVGTEGDVLLVQNDGNSTAYFALGPTDSVVAASQGLVTNPGGDSQAILAGAIMTFLIAPNIRYAAGICDAGETTVLRISRGTGQ